MRGARDDLWSDLTSSRCMLPGSQFGTPMWGNDRSHFLEDRVLAETLSSCRRLFTHHGKGHGLGCLNQSAWRETTVQHKGRGCWSAGASLLACLDHTPVSGDVSRGRHGWGTHTLILLRTCHRTKVQKDRPVGGRSASAACSPKSAQGAAVRHDYHPQGTRPATLGFSSELLPIRAAM